MVDKSKPRKEKKNEEKTFRPEVFLLLIKVY